MPSRVQYVQKLIAISEVEMIGTLEYKEHHDSWHVGTDDLEEWLEKFADKRVKIVISTHELDESHLLPVEEQIGTN